MDKFILYLIVGLVIIAIMLVVFNAGQFRIGRFSSTTIGTSGTDILNGSSSILSVGDTENEIYSPVHFINVQATYTEQTNSYDLPNRKLVNGLLFGSNEMLIDIRGLDAVTEAYLSFNVIDSNKYGPLLIFANNELIASASYNLGLQKMQIPDDKLHKLTGDVTLSVKPASSGWMIWAPSLYDIENAQIVITGLQQKTQELKFELTDKQIEGFQRGSITIDKKISTGNITVNFNNNQLYSGPTSVSEIDYESSLLKSDNMLEIVPLQNGKLIGDVNFLLYYKTRIDNTIRDDFELSSRDYNDLNDNEGRIVFEVVEIFDQGGVNVKLNGETICASSGCYPNVEVEETLIFTFDKNEAETGDNNFVISSVDDSAFTIKNLKVLIN